MRTSLTRSASSSPSSLLPGPRARTDYPRPVTGRNRLDRPSDLLPHPPGRATMGRGHSASDGRSLGSEPSMAEEAPSTLAGSGTVPRLNPNRRPQGTSSDRGPATAHRRGVEPNSSRGLPESGRRSLADNSTFPTRSSTSTFAANDGSSPTPASRGHASRCRYEREHFGSLLHADYHGPASNTLTRSSGWTMRAG